MFRNLKFISVLALLLSGPTVQNLNAQGVIPTKGTDFWLGYMDNHVNSSSQAALQLFVSSPTNTSGTVEIPLLGWSQNFIVNGGVTTTLTVPLNLGKHLLNDVIEQRGVHLTTMDTVSVFAINFERYSADGTKILPIQSLGTEYMISAYMGLTGFSGYHSSFLIVSTRDGTQVEITPSVPTLGGNPAGVPYVVNLDQGETYQVKGSSGGADLSGTTIVGTDTSGTCRPFAVFSGARCTNVPSNCSACDHVFEQNYPTPNWGSKYYLVPFMAASTYTYRIIARDNGTVVNVNGGAPINLNAGQVYEQNSEPGAVCITSNNPVNVTQFMEGVTCTGAGDPAMLILNAEDQKIDEVTFATVTSTVITQHNLNIIIDNSAVGTLTLDGVLVNPASFTTFASCPSHAYAQIPIAQGSHTLASPQGFTAYVYGTGSAESYAYSVGSFSPAPPLVVDTAFCDSGAITLSTPIVLTNTYWVNQNFPNDTVGLGPTITLQPPIIPGIYVATGDEFLSGCSQQYFYSVEVPNPPSLVITATEDTVCLFEQTQLTVTPTPNSTNYTYSWSPSSGFNNPSSSSPILTPTTSGWYVVEVSTLTGCSDTKDSIWIEVLGGDLANYDALVDVNAICDPDTVTLDAYLEQIVLYDHYDGGANGTLWSNISLGTASQNCGSAGGDALYFDGTGVRSAATNDLNVTNGGTISFFIMIANGTAAPCEDADFGDDVILEYSTNGGGTYTPIATYFESLYPAFTNISIAIPAGAQTAATRFRWRQLANDGVGTDNWALDDVVISVVDNTGFTYSWSPSGSVQSPTSVTSDAYPTQDTWYVLDIAAGSCVYSDSVFVAVDPQFTVDVGPDIVLCGQNPVQLNATTSIPNNYSYSWTPIGSLNAPFSANPIATPATTTTYIADVTSPAGCVNSDTMTITVMPGPTVNITANPMSICAGDTAQITANIVNQGAYTISWNNAGTLDNPNIANPQATPTTTTTYVLTMTDGNCTLQDSITIVAAPAFSITVSNDTTLCGPSPVNLNVTESVPGAYTYSWTPTNTLNSSIIPNPVANPTASTDYIVTVTNGANCSQTDTVSITFIPGPTLSVSANPTTICLGDSAQLDAQIANQGTYALSWNYPGTLNDPNISNPMATPTGTTTYIITLSDTTSTCVVEDSVTIVTAQPFQLTMPPDTVVCGTVPVTLGVTEDVVDNYTYSWTPGGTLSATNISNPIANATTTTNYIVTVTNPTGCIRTDSVNVFVIDAPTLSVSAVEDTLCWGGTTSLMATIANQGIYTGVWNNGGSLSDSLIINPVASPTITTAYAYTMTDTTGNCVVSDTVTVLMVPDFAITTINDTAMCDLGGLTLTTTHNSGTVESIVWSPFGLVSDSSILSPDYLPNASGALTVTLTDSFGCVRTDNVNLTLLGPGPFDLADTIICPGQSVTYDAGSPGSTYLWSTNETTQTINVSTTSTVWVTFTNPNNCVTTDSATVLVDQFSTNLGPDTSFCDGGSVDLDATTPGVTYLWNTNDVTPTITANTTGQYIVTLSSTISNCTFSDTIDIVVHDLPTLSINAPAEACSDQTVFVSAITNATAYDWNTNETTQTIIATGTGDYTVTVTDIYGCTTTGTHFIQFYDPPPLALDDQVICDTDSATFDPDADGTNSSVFWSTGSTNEILTLYDAGNYWVTLNNGNCVSTDSFTLTVHPLPPRVLLDDTAFCPTFAPEGIQLVAGDLTNTYFWNDSSTTNSITVLEAGVYSVLITTPEGCSIQDYADVILNCPPLLYIPNAFTPNGDGKNDIFYAVGENIIDFKLRIFNRWGELIYESTDIFEGWDGNYMGLPVESEVYVWRVDYTPIDVETQEYLIPVTQNGHVTVVR